MNETKIVLFNGLNNINLEFPLTKIYDLKTTLIQHVTPP